MFQIEKNIPIPGVAARNTKYPFLQLEVGDSFFVPCAEEQKKSFRGRLAGRVVKIKDRKFTVRSVDGGMRVWRIEMPDA